MLGSLVTTNIYFSLHAEVPLLQVNHYDPFRIVSLSLENSMDIVLKSFLVQMFHETKAPH